MQPDPDYKRRDRRLPGILARLFRSGSGNNRVIAGAIYDRIVAAARQPHFYAVWNVPDTPLGRFEMLSLHLFLALHRLKGAGPAADALGQEVTDAFFRDVDHSLRELGIGDMGIPKRMKKLARMFYGRATSYGAAIDSEDVNALAAALRRNVVPEDGEWQQAHELAGHVFHAGRVLDDQPIDEILAGRIAFPVPETAAAGARQ